MKILTSIFILRKHADERRCPSFYVCSMLDPFLIFFHQREQDQIEQKLEIKSNQKPSSSAPKKQNNHFTSHGKTHPFRRKKQV